MMKNVRESLAGRIGIMELLCLSRREKDALSFDNELDFSLQSLIERHRVAKTSDVVDLFEHIWRGGMPQVINADAEQLHTYFDSYIDTYLMRDVAELGGITDSSRFFRFLSACAALTSEQVKYKTLADSAGISQPTAKQWLTILEGLGIIFLLKPYSTNELKRLTKSPKLYFCDTGLCAHLSRWLTPETLMQGAASGHYFENHVVAELRRNYLYSRVKAEMTYYRDSNG